MKSTFKTTDMHELKLYFTMKNDLMAALSIEQLTPMLYTKDIPGTIGLYVNIPGFECSGYSEEWAWASLSYNQIQMMLAHPNEHVTFNKPVFKGSYYFSTKDVDAFWALVKDKTEALYEPENFEYGMRDFAIHDNNGCVLQFGTSFAQ